MSDEPRLTCTRLVRRTDGSKRGDGTVLYWHELCGLPAARYEFGGELTSAVAVLCKRHRRDALEELENRRVGKVPRPADPRQTTFLDK